MSTKPETAFTSRRSPKRANATSRRKNAAQKLSVKQRFFNVFTGRNVANSMLKNRGQPIVLVCTTLLALALASAPISAPALAEWQHSAVINASDYKQKNGHWDVINLPKEFRQNTIHAALLPTGKVLLVAGSGNNRTVFDQYYDGVIKVLKTVVYDPETNTVKEIPTPSDLFCSGHAILQSGNVLIAGGTSGYEILPGDVKKPAGAMLIHNEDPSSPVRVFKKGTKFISPTGKVYLSVQDVVVNPAMKMDYGNGNVFIMHSSTTVFVEAADADTSYITADNEHYNIAGLKGADTHNIYGQGGPMTLNKQDYRGDNKSYEFDPVKEEYVRVGDMNVARWYPSLPVLPNGDVLAVSGLDNTGQITDTTERYNPDTKEWTLGPSHAFPTYPALFQTHNPDVLFFSGSNAGYGPADKGRDPGFWNVRTNTFVPVTGLRQPNILETSGSVALPPAKGSNDGSQDNRIMVAGGGGVGESPLVTARTDIIDLADQNPHFVPGPDLPNPVRYINLVVTPWDEVFGTGGSMNYRAKGDSYSYKAFSYNPANNQVTPLADEIVGRNYHSGALLLPDGRILVFGGDPLYADKDNTTPGTFEQRLEIFTPPQLYAGPRPTLFGANNQDVHRGQKLIFGSDDAWSIKTARLIPPSSTTHVTNVEQRSVEAVVKNKNGNVEIDLPSDPSLLTDGWYMLFATNSSGTPSQAIWVHVTD